MSGPNDATRAQQRAADPGLSTWLTANAGSGKTRVLTDRVARLLLEGVRPERILCLTYTKAAAAEMQNRLFSRLGDWTMTPDAKLKEALGEIGLPDAQNTPELRRRARTLFAQAIETPGGLKIQTIHAFCAALLRRFPLEAGVAPGFREIDDLSGRRLRADLLDLMAGADDRAAFDAVAAHIGSEDALDALVQAIVRMREGFATPVPHADWMTRFGGDPAVSRAELLDRTLLPGDGDALRQLHGVLLAGSDRDRSAAAKLAPVLSGGPDPSHLPILESVLLTQSGKAPFTSKAGKFPTKAARAALGTVAETLDALMDRVEHARVQRLAMEAADRSAALHGFAAQLLPRLDALKTRRALLDFDDLVLRVRDMLGTSDVAQWVLFRLDGGIDHILLDEAQDTSPAQWDIVRALAREFAAGHGARPDVTRTLFVVGDPKQSIYSFQGADPDGFAQMGAHFRQTLSAGGGTFQDADLRFSFRSAPAILRAVDAAFTATGHHGLGDASGHLAFNSDMPGRVDLWPAIPPADTREEVEDFDAPVDALSAEAPKAVLARQIADEIAVWVSRGVQITDRNGKTRPLHGGDILILVRRRDALFHEVIRALKARDLPVAGADRLRIGAELAVKDLVALLKVLATPEDDLSLAAALRSPLFGWSEQDLFTLAAGRGPVYLWQALREARDTHPRTLAVLDDLRARADFLRPFELIDRILTRHGGRQALLARLGAEAEDGIDALLSQALGFETTEVPSLTGFLGWLDADKSDFKRPAESGAGAIRVMTVHGAKGLEAPVVILPSCERQASGRGDAVLAPAPDGAPAWASARDSAPEVLREALDAQREAREAEEQRLLYVAMTRAESWLVVAAAGATARKTGGDGPLESWYETVKAGLETLGAVPAEMPGGQGLRWEDGAWPDRAPEPGAAGPAETGNLLPDWSAAPPAPDPTPPPPLASSALGGAKVLTGEQADAREVEAAMAHGTAVHWLLETLPTLPRGDWAAIGAREAPEAYAEAVAVLDDPALAPLFTSDWLSEVTLQAPLAALGATRVLGVLDRVRVTSDRVEIIDYKTNAHVPGSASDVPEGLLRQMGAYAALAEIAFPGRQIETAILWTRTRSLMPLPHELVMAALARAELP